MSVAANSPSLPKAMTLCHSVRDSHAPVSRFFQLSLVARLRTVKLVLLSLATFDFGVLSDESDEIDCVLKHDVNFLICPSVGHPRSEWVPLPKPRSEFFWRVRSGLFAKRKTKSSIVRGNRNPEGRRTHEEGCRARSFNPEAVPMEGKKRNCTR